MLQAMSNASNSAGVADILNTRLQNINDMLGGDGGDASAYSAKVCLRWGMQYT